MTGTLVALQTQGGGLESLCQEETLSKSLVTAQNPMVDAKRLEEIERQVRDIETLARAEPSGTPPAFVRNCFDKKRGILKFLWDLATDSVRSRAEYFKLQGRYREVTQDNQGAHEAYRQALELDPSDFQASFKAYVTYLPIAIDKVVAARSQADIANLEKTVLENTDRLLVGVFRNPNTPRDLRAQAYLARAKLLQAMQREAEAVGDWKKALEADPKNFAALTQLAGFFRARNRHTEAQLYLEKLADHPSSTEAVYIDLIEYQLEREDFAGALRNAKKALRRFSQSQEVRTLMAQALAEVGRLPEAEKIANSLPASERSPRTRRLMAAIHQKKADLAFHKGRTSAALKEWELALEANPQDDLLRLRIVRMLYEHYRDNHFQPASAAHADMDYALKVLMPATTIAAPKPEVLRMHVSLVAQSSNPGQGDAACDKYKQVAGSFNESDLVMECVAIYKAAGKKGQARQAIEKALQNPRLKPSYGQLAEALTRL
jgi:tetratricopeptide (TPR) repeat protein